VGAVQHRACVEVQQAVAVQELEGARKKRSVAVVAASLSAQEASCPTKNR
jgi:hypothetical protein